MSERPQSVTIALSVVVLGISMPHLASGVATITDCRFYTAIFMACVFDLSQVAAEYAVIVMPIVGLSSSRLKVVCGFIVSSCTVISMTMNVRAFMAHVETPFEMAMACAWGCLLPVLVLLLVFVASSFVMRLHPTSPSGASPASA